MTTTKAPRLPYQPPQEDRRHYLFLDPCGCPFGLVEASPTKPGGDPRIASEDAAWDAMYDSRQEERAAHSRGVTVIYVTHAEYEAGYYDLMRSGCVHRGEDVDG
jgi:hypothetical protein